MKLNRLLIVSILLLAIFSIGAVCAAQDNVTADTLQIGGGANDEVELSSPLGELTTDGEDIAISNMENLKLSAIPNETVLSEGEAQNNAPKTYNGCTTDVLTIDDDDYTVFNCTIGTLTINGKNATIFNNVITNINGVGAGAQIYNNTISTVSLTSDNAAFHDNDVKGTATFKGDNVVIYKNNFSSMLYIGEYNSQISSVVYENIMNSPIFIYGNGTVFYNNTIDDKTGDGNRPRSYGLLCYVTNIAEIYDNNILNGDISTTRSNKNIIHDNYVHGKLTVNNGEDTNIYNNIIDGLVFDGALSYNSAMSVIKDSNNVYIYNNTIISGLQATGCTNFTVKNNFISTEIFNQYAVYLRSDYNVTVVDNKLYSLQGNGNDGVFCSDFADEALVEGNYPLKTILSISANDVKAGRTVTVMVSNENFPQNTLIEVFCDGNIYQGKTNWNGIAYIYINDLPAGEYVVLAMSKEVGDYEAGRNSTSFKVFKVEPTLDIIVSDAEVGNDVNVTVRVAEATGNVTFIVDGDQVDAELTTVLINEQVEYNGNYFTVSNEYGVATYTIKNITAGIHSAIAIYSGDGKYEGTIKSTSFKVEEIPVVVPKASVISITSVNGNAIVNGMLVDSDGEAIANATLNYTMGSEKASVTTLSDGTFTIVGIYNTTLSIVYSGNELINGTTVSIKLPSMAYSNVTADELVVDVDDAVVFNCTVGTLTVNGRNVTVFGNVISEINGAGTGVNVYGNNITKILLTGADAVVHDNDVKGTATLKGDNVVIYKNNFSRLTVGEYACEISSVVYDNIIKGPAYLYGNATVFYNNTIDDKTGDGNRPRSYGLLCYVTNIAEIYDNNILNGDISTTRSNKNIIHDNYVHGKLTVNNGEDTNIYNNIIDGLVFDGALSYNSAMSVIKDSNNVYIYNNTIISGLQATGCTNFTVKNNFISTEIFNQYAVYLRSDYNVTVVDNKLYSLQGNGNDGVFCSDFADEALVEGNYPLKTILSISANDVKAGRTVTVMVSNENFPQNTLIEVFCDGNIYQGKTNWNGIAYIYINDLPAGEYVVLAMSKEVGDYEAGRNSTSFKVFKVEPTLDIIVSDAEVGNDVNVTVRVAEATGNVTFIVDGDQVDAELTTVLINEQVEYNGNYFTVSNEYGVATYTIKNITAGIHSAIAIYSGDGKYEGTIKSTSFKVEEILINNVTVVVDGVEYVGELVNGTVTIKTNASEVSNNVTVVVDGVEYVGELVNGTVTIKTNASEVSNNVTVIVDGIEYSAEIINGTATIKTNSSEPANKTMTVVIDGVAYSGDLVNGSVVINNKIAKLTDTSISVAALNIKAGNKGTLKLTLKDANGKVISNATVKVVINSKTYSATTDADGIAKVSVKYAKAGTYYATAYYPGDNTYKSTIAKGKVVVTKKASKITAPKKTFKVKTKTKKVTVKLTSGKTVLKNKKVTLKVNGKTYTAKTNKKGIATLKITKLTKKGTFKYTVKFAGDNAYKAITKNGKIIVK